MKLCVVSYYVSSQVSFRADMHLSTSVTHMAVAQNWPGFGVVISGDLQCLMIVSVRKWGQMMLWDVWMLFPRANLDLDLDGGSVGKPQSEFPAVYIFTEGSLTGILYTEQVTPSF